MNKFVGINAISVIVENIKLKFAEKKHIHEISDVDGLQERLDAIVPSPDVDIENPEDVVIRINQLTQMVNSLTASMEALIPAVGEIYISTSNENPSVRFGGTWRQIKDTFLLAAGDAYSLGSVGGEAEHTLTINEIPSHAHTYKRHAFDRNDSDPTTGEDVYGANNKTLAAHEGTTDVTGGGQPHNNMPPYLAVSIWERIA